MKEQIEYDDIYYELSDAAKQVLGIYEKEKKNEAEIIAEVFAEYEDEGDQPDNWKITYNNAGTVSPGEAGPADKVEDAIRNKAGTRKDRQVFVPVAHAAGPGRKKRLALRRTNNCLIMGLLILSAMYMDYFTGHIIASVWALDGSMLRCVNIPIVLLVINCINYIYASTLPYWSYYHRKKWFIMLHTVIIGLAVLSACVWLDITYLVPRVIHITSVAVFEALFSENVKGFLIAMTAIGPAALIALIVMLRTERWLLDRRIFRKLCAFRLLMHLDLRSNKKYLYDMCVIRYQNNKHRYVIREEDRYLHCLVVGPTGTAKTSSILLPMIRGDLISRCRNTEKLKKIMWEGLVKGYFELNGPLTNEGFNLDAFTPVTDMGKKILKKIKKYRTCGFTVLGPDASLSDKVYEMCKEYNIQCNRVDPVPDNWQEGTGKEGFAGFNLLYIPDDTPAWMRPLMIRQRAILLADVLQEISLMSGDEERFYQSVDRAVTVTITICLCATYPIIQGRQANLKDVQEVINDFDRIRKYYEALKRINACDDRNPYGAVIDMIKNDMLGDERRRQKLAELALGLRNTFEEVLAHPLICDALCPTDDKTLDMDKMLAEGQVTAINFAQALGDSCAKWFGLILLLSFFKAVLRRNGAQGTAEMPHYVVVDELPVILTDAINTVIAQFRKFRVGFIGAIQSLDQMDRNEQTKSLKRTLLSGCATHILFGRQGLEEIISYSRLAGREMIIEDLETVERTRSSRDGVNVTSTSVISPQYVDWMPEEEARYRDFQEVTVFGVRDSVVIKPFVGRCEFISDEDSPIKIILYNWDKYRPAKDNTIKNENNKKTIVEVQLDDLIEEYGFENQDSDSGVPF